MGNTETVADFFTKDDVLFSGQIEMPTSKDTAIDLLNKKNKSYEVFDNLWTFYLDSYEGGPNFASRDNLFRHVRETEPDFTDRVKRAVYLNYAQPLVNFFSNFIFSEEISRDGGKNNEEFQRFIKNVNGKGDSMDLFMREVCDLNQIFGHIDILVDKREKDDNLGTLSLQQEQDLGLDSPYFVLLYPHEVYDWRFSVTGKFLYLKRCVSDEDHKTYTIWYPDRINKIVVKVNSSNKEYISSSDMFENPLGEVPVVRSFYRKSKKYKDMGSSFLADIAFINRHIMNITSLISEFLARQCVVGDTLIDCPRDLEKYPYGIPIKDLVGKEFPTYTWDIENQKYVIRKAYDVRKTGEKQPVYRLKFEYKDEYNQNKEGHLDATGNHPVLLQNGKYIDLKKLKKGDKLVPFYRWMDGYPRGNRPHILQTLNLYSGIAEHRFVVRETGGVLLKDHHIHHKDGRSLNNLPDNLEQITEEEHKKIEAGKLSERAKKWWREASLAKKKAVTTKAMAGIKKWRDENPEEVKRAYRQQSKSIKKTLNKLTVEERKQKVAKALEYQSSEEAIKNMILGRKKWWEKLSKEERVAKMDKFRGGKTHKEEKANHVVVSVEYLGEFDVYNLEVEEHHNYIANGVVVHNCFNLLAKEADSSLPFADQSEGNIGTSNIMEIPRGAQFPQYLSPPIDCSQFLQSEREKMTLEAYRIATAETGLEAFTGQSRSGDAQSQSFHKVIPYIASRASDLEKTEISLSRLWLKWSNVDAEWTGHIKYKSDYSVQNFASMLLHLKMLFSDIKVPSATFIKSEMLRIIQTYNSKIESEDLEKIKQEIEAGVTDEYIQRTFGSNKVGANNLRGQVNTQQLTQGMVQENLGDNKKISMLGADNVA